MLAKQEMFLDFIANPTTQLIIPVYQRVYTWGRAQCDTLWADIERAGRTGGTHFIGTVLHATEPGTETVDARLDIIDGQQRTATLTLLLAALRDWMRETGSRLDGIDAETIDRRYLHAGASATEMKLVLSRMDRKTLEAIVQRTPLPQDEEELSANVVDTYQLFHAKMAESFDIDAARIIWNGMQRLMIISASLDGDDRPQLIFESLNSKGMPLTTADLIRNLLLVNAGYDEQTRLYNLYWAPIEHLYADDPNSQRLNAALHGFLATTAPKLHIANKDQVYGAFKAFMEDMYRGSLEELLIGLKGFCTTFAAKSNAQSARRAQEAAAFGHSRPEGLIADKKLFGD